ncbi:unnamed protein product [Mytilus coruscus]|uniref:B box-type domain-containing protein n=1 Tax=Mytilus coruscus TaxID=42192 RepID=A0A6J8A1U6_MYTCO|nr:unnamed protein product [Mytilus coruscus]
MEQVAVSKCDICKEDIGKVFCYECNKILCQSCTSVHEKFPATKRHTVTDSHSVDRSSLIHQLVCKHHNLEFAYHCRCCECLICAQCVTSLHMGHSITGIAEVAATARGDVKKRLETIKDSTKNLSDLIEDFKTTKQTKLQTGTDNFIKEVNEVSQDLTRIIESIAEINLTHASDFLVFEKQQLFYNVAKLNKSYSEYSSIQERYERILKDKHDVTFFFNQTSLAKEFDLLDDIPIPEEPKEIEPLKRDVMVDSVINKIESKYSTKLFFYRRFCLFTPELNEALKPRETKGYLRSAVNLNLSSETLLQENHLVSVGIQIGREESGCAMSFRDKFEMDPCNVFLCEFGSYGCYLTQKIPNSILLDSDGNLVAFGQNAEDQYLKLLEGENHQDVYFFKQFTKDIPELLVQFENDCLEIGELDIYNFVVKTFDRKKKYPAVWLLKSFIDFYVDHVLHKIDVKWISTTDVQLVVTIPPYWNRSMRNLISRAAELGTIVTSDPEAVSLYWKYLSEKNTVDKRLHLFQPERKYMVVNCSGDAIDLTCWMVEEDKSLTKLISTVTVSEDLVISEGFKKFIVSIVGENVYSLFCIQNSYDETDMLKSFEIRAMHFQGNLNAENLVRVTVPVYLQEQFKEKLDKNNVYSQRFKLQAGKIQMDSHLFESLLEKVITTVVNSVKEILKVPDVMDTSFIICSGRTMELPCLRLKMRETFQGINIIEIPELDEAALKGAVILGHYPKVCFKRIFYRL